MKTYLFSGDSGLNKSSLESMLRSAGYDPYPDGAYVKNGVLLLKDGPCNIKYVDFLYVENFADKPFDPNTYHIKCDWHSIHEASTVYPLCRKDRLHDALGGRFIAKTWNLMNFEYTAGVYILRPSHMLAASGIDIKIVDSAETFAEARDFYMTKISAHANYHKKHMQYYQVIVSEYIADPLLFSGRKFHLRLYGLNLSTRAGFWIARGHGKILTASEQFILAEYERKSIHDTHLDSTDRDYVYPDDFPEQGMLEGINRQLDELETALAAITQARSYEQAQRSFEIYGIDVMVRTDGSIVLIEVNDRPGMGGKDPRDSRLLGMFDRHCKWLAGHLWSTEP